MVITNVNQVVYQGDGVTTAFPFTFRIIDATDIKLLLLDSDGTETDITSDYFVDTENDTVHYPGYAPGAEPALSDRPPVLAEGQKLVIYRKLPITQEKDLGDKWPFSVIELGLDKLTMILQDIWDWLGRCLCVSKGQAYDAGDDFDPTVPLEADKVICGNANGTGFDAREALMEVNGHWVGKGRQIKGVAEPEDNQDAATKNYVDDELDTAIENLQLLADVVVDSGELQHITDQFNAIDANAAAAAESEDNAATSEANALSYKNAAAASATNASNSASSASTTATQLMAYLDTKETLTAPAVDPTLSISGAAADAKVTGDEFATVTRKMELVETTNLFNVDGATAGYITNTGSVGPNVAYKWVKIDVEEGDVYKTYYINGTTVTATYMRYVCAYDGSGNVVSASGAESVNTYTVPSGVAKIAVTVLTSESTTLMLLKNNATPPTQYIPWILPYYQSGTGFVVTDKTLTETGVPADAKSVGDKLDEILPVTPKDASFFYVSPNLVNPATNHVGYYVKPSNGTYASNANYIATDYLEVVGGESYGMGFTVQPSNSSDCFFAWFNENKTYISGDDGKIVGDYNFVITAPANAKYLRYSASKDLYPIIIAEGSAKLDFIPYNYAYLLPQYLPPDTTDITVNLPKKIYATVGYETNIYFENLVEHWEKYSWDVTCTKGEQWERGYKFTPTEADVGTVSLSIKIYTDNISKTVSTSLVISSANAGNGETVSMIILGDSTTANGIAVTKLHENFADDVMSIQTLGTRGTAPNNHEGRSGWTLNKYFTVSSDGGVNNPFYNPLTQTFDASYYFTETEIAYPDWFIVNMGINDMFSYTTDAAMNTAIETLVGYVDDIIESVLSANASIKLGICITIPPNHSQDPFGKSYGCNQTRDRYKRNNLYWANRLIEEYDNRTAESIYLIPIYANLDTVYNFGMETIPVNARNTAMTYESPIANGSVHPAETGYWQIADVYTAFLKAQA